MAQHEGTVLSLPIHMEQDNRPARRPARLGRIVRRGGPLALAATVALLTSSCSSGGEARQTASTGSTTTQSGAPGSAHNSSSLSSGVVVNPGPGPATLVPNSHHREVEQFGANSFADYTHASGIGPYLPKGQAVDVDCLMVGSADAAPSTHGYWYHVEGPAPYIGYYVAANTFENGDINGPLNTQPAIDPAIASTLCPGSLAAPSS